MECRSARACDLKAQRWRLSVGAAPLGLVLVLVLVFALIESAAGALYGTWIQQHPTPLPLSERSGVHHVDGLPPGTCDHVTLPIGGAKLWSTMGSSDNDAAGYYNLQSVWVLDTSVTPPAWHIDAQQNTPRTRTAPIAVYNSRQRRVWMFSGFGYEGLDPSNNKLLDDVIYYDLTTQLWTTLVPVSSNFVSNPGPVGRAWSDAVWTNETNQRSLFMFGGSCTYDGETLSVHAHDCDDTWQFDVEALQWIGSRNLGRCVDSTVKCSDAQAIVQLVPSHSFAATVRNFTALLDTTSLVRPANLLQRTQLLMDYAESIYAQLNVTRDELALNTTLTTNRNDTIACGAVCNLYDSESNYTLNGQPYFIRPALVNGVPKRLEGGRVRCVDGKCYLFGGYTCLANGVTGAVGPTCYSNIMYVFDLATKLWTALEQPTDPANPQYAVWPSPRSYASMTLVGRKLIVFGGGYVDQALVQYYYNSLHAFDIDTRQWESVTARGLMPLQRWSHTMTLASPSDHTLWLFGGCYPPFYTYGDVWQFVVGLQIVPENVFAFGPGMNSAVAGVGTAFQLQTCAWSNDPTQPTARARGAPLEWGVGLPLSVQILGVSDTETALVQGVVTDIGSGVYNVSYTASRGETLDVFISLDGVQIPGSPYRVRLIPSRPSGALSHTRGVGLQGAVRGKETFFTIAAADQYGNPMTTGGFADNITVTVLETNSPVDGFRPEDKGDGTYVIHYTAPDEALFRLQVTLLGARVLNSPFSVVGYTDPAVSSAGKTAAIVLVTLAIAVLAAMCIAIIVGRNSDAVRAGSPTFLSLQLVGGIVALSSVYTLTEVTDARCQALPWVLGIGFMLVLSSLYGKLYRVQQIFTQRQVKKVSLSDTTLLLFPAVTVGVDILFFGIWLGVAPLKAITVAGEDTFTSFKACDCSNFGAWSGVAYTYHALLLLYGVFLASSTKAVPKVFNESKLLATVLYNSAMCGLAVPILYVFVSEPASAFLVKVVALLYAFFFACVVMTAPRVWYIFFPPPKEFFSTAPKSGAAPNRSQARSQPSNGSGQEIELQTQPKAGPFGGAKAGGGGAKRPPSASAGGNSRENATAAGFEGKAEDSPVARPGMKAAAAAAAALQPDSSSTPRAEDIKPMEFAVAVADPSAPNSAPATPPPQQQMPPSGVARAPSVAAAVPAPASVTRSASIAASAPPPGASRAPSTVSSAVAAAGGGTAAAPSRAGNGSSPTTPTRASASGPMFRPTGHTPFLDRASSVPLTVSTASGAAGAGAGAAAGAGGGAHKSANSSGSGSPQARDSASGHNLLTTPLASSADGRPPLLLAASTSAVPLKGAHHHTHDDDDEPPTPPSHTAADDTPPPPRSADA